MDMKDDMLIRVFEGEATREELLRVRAWVHESEEHRAHFELLRRWWNVVGGPVGTGEEERAEWRRFRQRTGLARRRRIGTWRWAAAAVAVVMGVLISTSSVDWEYFLDVTAPEAFTYAGGTNTYSVKSYRKSNTGKIEPVAWEAMGDGAVAAGHALGQAGLLFEKMEDAVIQAQIDKLEATKKANEMATAQVTPAKEDVSFDDFQRMDIRVGKIIAAEKVAKTKKLMKLTVDTGIDQRTIVSGIAEHYSPEEVVGRQVSVLVNLAPKPLKGIVSQGMILMAENADGSLSFVAPDKDVKPGSEVR